MSGRVAISPGRLAVVLALPLAVIGLSCGGSGPPKSEPGSRRGTVRPGVSEIDAPAEDRVAAGQVVYVPAYSHVYTADNAEPLNLAMTLFVRNTDPARSIILTRVEYFDSGGKRLRELLPKPLQIGPMASVDFFVEESDESGGASPSLVVRWAATEPTSNPVVESVMIGTAGTQGISFTAQGRAISSIKP